jgi:flagellar assembly factor FliW
MMTTLPAETTVLFPAGLPGFEACRRYVLIQAEAFAPGVCLKGLEGPAPAFFAVDPRHVDPGYATELSPADRARLGADADTPCMWLALVSTGPGEPRANLAAPIVINPTTMRGIQVLPADAAAPADVPWTEAPCLS